MRVTTGVTRLRTCAGLLAGACVMLSNACGPSDIQPNRPLPRRTTLDVVAAIKGNESFIPTGIAGVTACEILVVGGRWGTIVRIQSDGTIAPTAGRIPGYRLGTRLESADGRDVLAWSHTPEFLGHVVAQTLEVEPLGIPEHAWGRRWVGPAANLPEGKYALLPLGDRAMPRAIPNARPAAPLVYVAGNRRTPIRTAGTVPDVGGRYLSWLASAGTIGTVGDTILVLLHGAATLQRFAPSGAAMGYELVSQRSLPGYFDAPQPREQVRSFDWIQINGDLTRFTHVPQIAAAAFGRDGTVYTIRNYGAEWQSSRNRFLEDGGRWKVTDRALEVFHPSGRLLGAFDMPDSTASWVRGDVNGRLFFDSGSQDILVVDDPTRTESSCPPLPKTIVLPATDVPKSDSRSME